MKILHLSNTAGKLGGGVAQVVQSIFSHQLKKGFSSFLWFIGKKKEKIELSEELNVDKANISVIKFFFGIRYLFYPSFFIKAFIKKYNYNIIHQHGVFLPTSVFSLIKSYTNSKILISPHGFLEPEKMRVSTLKKKIVLFLFEKRNLKKSDCFIACSQQEAFFLDKLGYNKPIAIIPNGVDDIYIESIIHHSFKKNFLKNKGIPNDSKILLFLSRVHPFKGLLLFLKSLAQIKNEFKENGWVFVIAGPDELNHKKDLISFINKNKITDLVKFIGPVYGDEKLAILDAAKCFILPSKGENFGISVIEAMSRKKPVITTKNTPWQELITNNCGWWVERNLNSLCNVILELIKTDDESLKIMGLNGHSLVKNKYVWSKISNDYIDLYNWVISDFKIKDFKNLKIYKRKK